MPDYLQSEVWKNYPIRPYPEKGKPWFVLVLIEVLTLAMLAGYLTGYFVACFTAGMVVAVYIFSVVFPLRYLGLLARFFCYGQPGSRRNCLNEVTAIFGVYNSDTKSNSPNSAPP